MWLDSAGPRGRPPGGAVLSSTCTTRNGSEVPQGTIVATEGGPGYATTGSRATATSGSSNPCSTDTDLLLVDNRRDGRVPPVTSCPALQSYRGDYERNTESDADGGSDRARSLYGTALAADHQASILDALGITRVSLYGDSYRDIPRARPSPCATQNRLDTLVLDRAVPGEMTEISWYRDAARAVRDAFRFVCARDLQSLPGEQARTPPNCSPRRPGN